MTSLFVKVFAERNCGAPELTRDIKRAYAVTPMRSEPDLDRNAMRTLLQRVPPRERADLQNHLLDMEHDRILYSDFGWGATAPSADIIQSAAHSADTLFIGVTMHPVAFAMKLSEKPKTPGAAAKETPFLEWLAQPFPVFRRDGLGDLTPLPPLALWTAKARAILALADTGYKVVLTRTETLHDTIQKQITPHLLQKEGERLSLKKTNVPNWEPTLRRLPAASLREFYVQIDPGVLRALGHDPL